MSLLLPSFPPVFFHTFHVSAIYNFSEFWNTWYSSCLEYFYSLLLYNPCHNKLSYGVLSEFCLSHRVSHSVWVLVHTRFVSALWASLVGIGFESKHEFAPSTVLLGLPLCPWTWAISSKSLQLHAAAAQVPTVLLGLLCPWTWGISSQPLQNRTAASPSANLIRKSLCCYLITPCTRSQPKDFYSSSSLCLESSSSR